MPGAEEPRIRIRYEKKDVEGKPLYTFDESITNDVLKELIEDMHVMDGKTAEQPESAA